MNDSFKFEEAIHLHLIGKTEWLSVDDITAVRLNDEEKFFSEMRGRLYCPECKSAKLQHNLSNSPYLSTYPGGKHLDGCSMGCEIASKKECIEFCENEENYKKIERALFNCIEKMLTNDVEKYIFTTNIESIKDINTNEKMNTNGINLVKSIPCKILTRKFKDVDYGCYKYFYGKVDLESKESKIGNFKIVVKHSGTNNWICSINTSGSVYSHISVFNSATKINNCYIAFLGIMTQNNKYNNSYINHSSKILIKK